MKSRRLLISIRMMGIEHMLLEYQTYLENFTTVYIEATQVIVVVVMFWLWLVVLLVLSERRRRLAFLAFSRLNF